MEHVGEIEKRLWSVADHLRANSNFASNEYFLPMLSAGFCALKMSMKMAVSRADIWTGPI